MATVKGDPAIITETETVQQQWNRGEEVADSSLSQTDGAEDDFEECPGVGNLHPIEHELGVKKKEVAYF